MSVRALAALILLFTTKSYSQEVISDAIIVTADKISSPLETSPSDIKVFTQKEIAASSSVVELLKKESDLSVIQSGPKGGSTSLFLRGNDSSHTLVVIDGIIMNDPSNPNRQFDLGRLSLNNIERIEILKGSQGLLYGSNAIGGVVVITSKQAADSASGGATFSYGSFDTFESAVNAQKKYNKTSVSVGLDHLKTRGFSAANSSANTNADDDGEKRFTLTSAITQELSQDNELVFNYRFVDDVVDLDKGGGPLSDDPNDSQSAKQHYFKAGYNHTWESSETKFYYARSQHQRTLEVKRDSLNPAESSVKSTGDMDLFSLNHVLYTNAFLTQNINLDYQQEVDQSDNFNDNLSLFLYNRVEYGPAVANFGARIDSNKYFGEHVTYKIALMHFFSRFTLKMNYSTGFRSPSLNQLFDPTYGNKNLLPEKSKSADISFDVPLGEKLKLLTTFFHTKIDDRHSYDPVTFINLNKGDARINGVENKLTAKFTESLDADLSFTFLDAQDVTANMRLPRRSKFTARSLINYEIDRYSLSLENELNNSRSDIDNLGNPVEMPSYALFHFYANADLSNHFQTYLWVKNLLDHDYEEVYGYGTGGRAATIGLKYSY